MFLLFLSKPSFPHVASTELQCSYAGLRHSSRENSERWGAVKTMRWLDTKRVPAPLFQLVSSYIFPPGSLEGSALVEWSSFPDTSQVDAVGFEFALVWAREGS